ncbi:MAG: DUF4492 domain-containing protein [Bacteroidaceae bacterium]|nr:DUF4492 domain-containing protein [Bacteroidaceae bacterium]
MSLIGRIVNFYVEGFRGMTIGRTLWAVIIVKLIIIFLILKLLFFPNFIGEHADEGGEAEFVFEQVVGNRE